ncbi:MAG: phosphatase PAP2 family protein [Oscillospiraceae bacterium]|jgi:membrane-associated phospholipid phosphatase
MQGNVFYFDWEVEFMEWFQGLLGDGAVKVFSLISALGETAIMVVIIGALYLCIDKEYGLYVGTNIMCTITLNPFIKNIFLRRRPYFDNPGIKCLKPVDSSADIYDITAQDYSFPSGHSTNSTTAYVSLARYRRTMGKRSVVLDIIAVLFPFLIGVSRVALGVHYPTDVIAGWALGVAVSFLLPYILYKVKRKYLVFIGMAVIFLPGFFFCKTNDFYTGYGTMVGFYAAYIFEEKFVKFGKPKNFLFGLIRVVGCGAVYLGMNALLKLPFSSDFLTSASTAAFIVRAVRHAIVIFCVMGLYPWLFNYWETHSRKKEVSVSE